MLAHLSSRLCREARNREVSGPVSFILLLSRVTENIRPLRRGNYKSRGRWPILRAPESEESGLGWARVEPNDAQVRVPL